ncbi:MAG TPA: N-acetyltransferase [Nitrospirales bacterium]|jgi:ribosomal protein S18 acetylase RimI-like enzyme|nr:N-acetyltransferase [Nitrospirales bacterium]HIB54605.1 N-acetyltransferase [Nitrospirales bacterium]HIC05057.1 N-acetyltransferase [Nitrospirales bacterium]HIN33402.1 N-acetyltransferase [Nitrospirales bacterium]HIO22432.1 N-acetyltransferase [Nitrospirales bacterium]
MTQQEKPITIRHAAIDDVDTIAEYNIAMALETEGISLDLDRVTQGVRSVLHDPSKGFYILAGIESRVVGQMMVTFEWSDWRNGVFWWIQSVYVHPDHRRLSIFTQLYRHVERSAKETDDVCGLRLYVENENAIAQSTYQCLGMTQALYKVYETDFVISRSPHGNGELI